MTDIRDGRRQGFRVNDDRELIYDFHEDRGSFELRRNLREFPHLLRAMECLCRALRLDVDFEPGELTEKSLARGYHEARP